LQMLLGDAWGLGDGAALLSDGDAAGETDS
jgi:hypothetical protein